MLFMPRLRVLSLATPKLLFFWASEQFKLFNDLPKELVNVEEFTSRMKRNKPFEISVAKSVITKYTNNIQQLATEIKSLHMVQKSNDTKKSTRGHTKPSQKEPSFLARQIGFFSVRFATILAIFGGYYFEHYLNYPKGHAIGSRISSIVSSCQFIVLPYSLFVSVSYGLETAFALFSGHLLFFPMIKYIVDLICPSHLNIYITFSPLFLLIFIIIDQILCGLCLLQTSATQKKDNGMNIKISSKRIIESIWYGFLNCKTYFCVLFGLLFGVKIPVTAWLVEIVLSSLCLSDIIDKYIGCYWNILFYHTHRLAHLNYIYPDAHKFHHYLNDATAFDAHVFGSGAPEEWLLIWIEYFAAVWICGGLPPGLSFYVLKQSWANKWGHSRDGNVPEDDYENFHVDHHARHYENFGNHYPLEMIMKTTVDKEVIYNGFKLKRVESRDSIILKCIPLKTKVAKLSLL